MDLMAFAAEFWWLGPALIGGGAVAVTSVRFARRERERTIEYAAARFELDAARTRLRDARAALKRAQGDLLVAKGDAQSRLGVPAARTRVDDAQRELRAAQSGLRGSRTQVQAARVQLRGAPAGPDQLPLPRLMAAHDAVVRRWMAYETDPAAAIEFPAMLDVRQPATAALLTALDRARWLRPSGARMRLTASQFSHYRRAVAELEAAFATAETAARQESAPRLTDSFARTVSPELRDAWAGWLRGAKATASAAVSAAADALDTAVRAAPSAPEHPKTDDGRAPWPVPRRSTD